MPAACRTSPLAPPTKGIFKYLGRRPRCPEAGRLLSGLSSSAAHFRPPGPGSVGPRRGGASVEWVRRPLPQSDFFYEHVLAAHGLPPLLGTPSWGRPRPGFGGDDSLFRRLTCPMTYPSHRGEKVSHPRRLRPDVVCAAPRAPGIAPRRGDPRRPGAHPRAEGVPYHPGPGPDPRRLRELPPPARLDARHAHAVAGRPQQGPAKILRCSAYRARLSSRGD